MQKDTKHSRKIASTVCAAVVIAILGIYLAIFLYTLLDTSCGEWIAIAVLIVYGLVILALIAGVLAALRQRLREIEGGEEDDAKKY